MSITFVCENAAILDSAPRIEHGFESLEDLFLVMPPSDFAYWESGDRRCPLENAAACSVSTGKGLGALADCGFVCSAVRFIAAWALLGPKLDIAWHAAAHSAMPVVELLDLTVGEAWPKGGAVPSLEMTAIRAQVRF